MFNMGDLASIKGKIVNSQKRRPNVILHTRNVMIPVVKPVPFKQSCDMPFSESRCQILRAKNYSNNPALLFSETPLHTLYDPLENSIEVNPNLYILEFSFSFSYYVLLNTISKKILKILFNILVYLSVFET